MVLPTRHNFRDLMSLTRYYGIDLLSGLPRRLEAQPFRSSNARALRRGHVDRLVLLRTLLHTATLDRSAPSFAWRTRSLADAFAEHGRSSLPSPAFEAPAGRTSIVIRTPPLRSLAWFETAKEDLRARPLSFAYRR